MWISFKNRKPKQGIPLITRSPGYERKGNCFEDWRIWKTDIISYNPPPTHWWDGVNDFDRAIDCWPRQEPSEEC